MSLLLLLSHLATNYTRGTSSSLPATTADLTTVYSAADYSAVSADDGSYVEITGSPYLIHQFKYKASSNTQSFTITWNGKSTIAPTSRPVYLQVWNKTSAAWENLSSNATASADTDFTLTGSKTTNLSNYYETDNTVTARVYQ